MTKCEYTDVVCRCLCCLLYERVGRGRAVCTRCSGTVRSKMSRGMEEVSKHTVLLLAMWIGGEEQTHCNV